MSDFEPVYLRLVAVAVYVESEAVVDIRTLLLICTRNSSVY